VQLSCHLQPLDTIKLEEVWGTSIVQLNCHLQPLDTMASSRPAALRHLEEKKSQLLGKDCVAAKIPYKSISFAVTISAIP
jgi:hypothetical protein